MTGDNGPSTNDKISMKDHDILVSLHTQVGNLIGQVQTLSHQVQNSQAATYNEFKSMAISQTKLEGEIETVRSRVGNLQDRVDGIEAVKANVGLLQDRVDSLDAKWKIGDLVTGVMAAVAGFFAWMK